VRDALRWKGTLPQGCGAQLGLQRNGVNAPKSQGVVLVSCERQTGNQSEWWLTVLRPQTASGPMTLHFSLERRCTPKASPSQPCPVVIRQRLFRRSPTLDAKTGEPTEDLWKFFAKIQDGPAEQFQVASPRIALGKDRFVIVAQSGGYTVSVPSPSGQPIEIVGPTYDADTEGSTRLYDWHKRKDPHDPRDWP
jgi:hypothetical protein